MIYSLGGSMGAGDLIERILSDGVVTPQELRELHDHFDTRLKKLENVWYRRAWRWLLALFASGVLCAQITSLPPGTGVVAKTCGGTDKFSAVDATGNFTCTADQTGAGSGDAITVATVAATDPDFINSPTIALTLDTIAAPDTILWAVVANSIGPTQIDETGNYTWTGIHSLAGATLSGASPLVLEGLTADAFEATITVTDPTADRTFTIPNADSVAIQPLTCGGTDKVSAVSAAGVITCSADASGAGGDSITVATIAATDPDLIDTATIDVTLDTVAAPDTIKWDVIANSIGPTQVDETGNYTWTGIHSLAGATLAGASPIVLEGGTVDGFETTIAVTDPTAARTFTIPNADSVAIQPDTGAANNFLTAVSAAGLISKAQPSFTNLSGSLALGQTPLTTRGDLLTVDATPALIRLALGADKKVPVSNGSDIVWQYVRVRSHATDCTALTDGKEGEACYEQDANTFYICEPSAGDCDTAGEWLQIGGGGSNHNILSATHSDSAAGTVVRGDLIVGNSTPAWARFAIGASKKVVTSDGTDVAYQYVRARSHATDCTSLTDGNEGEICYEQDADTIYVCEPTAGACDTAAEWRQAGGGGAPTGASYVVISLDGTLSAERVLTAGSGISLTDAGANGAITVALSTSTSRISMLTGRAMPDTSGNVFLEPYSIKATNDFFVPGVWIYNDTSTDLILHGDFLVPSDFVSGAKACVEWTSTATTGNARWQFGYRSHGGDDTNSLDQTTAEETVEANDVAPTAAHRRLALCQTLTDANIAAGDRFQFRAAREGSDTVNDTMAAAAIVFDWYFEYTGRP